MGRKDDKEDDLLILSFFCFFVFLYFCYFFAFLSFPSRVGKDGMLVNDEGEKYSTYCRRSELNVNTSLMECIKGSTLRIWESFFVSFL